MQHRGAFIAFLWHLSDSGPIFALFRHLEQCKCHPSHNVTLLAICKLAHTSAHTLYCCPRFTDSTLVLTLTHVIGAQAVGWILLSVSVAAVVGVFVKYGTFLFVACSLAQFISEYGLWNMDCGPQVQASKSISSRHQPSLHSSSLHLPLSWPQVTGLSGCLILPTTAADELRMCISQVNLWGEHGKCMHVATAVTGPKRWWDVDSPHPCDMVALKRVHQ